MADLEIDFNLLQELIDSFESVRSGFELLATTGCPSVGSDDPLAEHHVSQVKLEEQSVLAGSMVAFTNARDGAQAAYNAFKTADSLGGV